MIKKYVKRIFSSLFAILMLFVFSACSQQPKQQQTEQPQQNETETQSEVQSQQTVTTVQNNNTFVIYFSATGNTETVANYIADTLNADIYQIIPE